MSSISATVSGGLLFDGCLPFLTYQIEHISIFSTPLPTNLVLVTHLASKFLEIFLNIALIELVQFHFRQIDRVNLMPQRLYVIIILDNNRHTDPFQCSGSRVRRHQTQHGVQQKSRSQMWHWQAGIRCFRMLVNPFRLIGRVIQNDITNRRDAPVTANTLDNLFHIIEWHGDSFCGVLSCLHITKCWIDFQLIAQRICGAWITQLLRHQKIPQIFD